MKSAKWWLCWAGALWLSVGCAFGATEIVDGIEWEYSYPDGMLYGPSDKSLAGDVVIPSVLGGVPISSIAAHMSFSGCTGLTSVVIPDSVTSIGEHAFSDCNALTNVVIPNSVTNIGSGAFYECVNLYDTNSFPGLCLVDGWVVGWNDGLSEDVALTGIRGIASGAFYECGTLMNVSIPDSVKSIGEFAFSGCSSLTNVTIGDGVTCIGRDAFYNCSSLMSVAIGDGVTSIGDGAFYYCSNLASVTIPNGVAYIGSYAFYECGALDLNSVTIPDSVTSIGESAFYGTYNGDWETIMGVCLVDGWAVRGEWLFGDVDLTGIRGIADRVFADCYELTSVTIPVGVTRIGNYAFSGCSALTNVTFPEGLTSIGEWAFNYCTNLTSITIPGSVTSIGGAAFSECTNLTAVYIHDLGAWCGISFGDYSANPLSYAHHLYLDGEEVGDVTFPAHLMNIGSWTFSGCIGLTNITIPNEVTSIGSGTFYDCSGLTSVTIPDGVPNIGGSLFSGCSNLTTVAIPGTVTNIGNQAFANCRSLTSVTIPDGVTRIGNQAFSNCWSLVSVTIPESVTNIGYASFSNCRGLTRVTILGNDTSNWSHYLYGSGVWTPNPSPFYPCTNLSTIVLGGKMTQIGDFMFYKSYRLKSVTIPDGVTSIGNYSFYGCSGLTDVTIANSVTNIGDSAFSSCTGLETLYVPASWEGSSKLAKAAVPSSCTIVYRKSAQSVAFDPIGPQTAAGRVELGATAAGGGAVAFEVVSGPGVLEGNELVFTGSGTVVVKATAEGGVDWEAGEATREIVAVAEGAAAPIPASEYEAWVRETAGLDGGAAPQSARGANGRENWENYVCDIAPGSTNELEMAEVELDEQGRLVFRVGAASARRWYSLLVWDDLGEAPSEIDLGRGESGMTVTNGNLDDGGFTRLKVRLTE